MEAKISKNQQTHIWLVQNDANKSEEMEGMSYKMGAKKNSRFTSFFNFTMLMKSQSNLT